MQNSVKITHFSAEVNDYSSNTDVPCSQTNQRYLINKHISVSIATTHISHEAKDSLYMDILSVSLVNSVEAESVTQYLEWMRKSERCIFV